MFLEGRIRVKASIEGDQIVFTEMNDFEKLAMPKFFNLGPDHEVTGPPHELHPGFTRFTVVRQKRQVALPYKGATVWVDEAKEGAYRDVPFLATVVEVYSHRPDDNGMWELLVEPIKADGVHRYYALRRADKVTVLK